MQKRKKKITFDIQKKSKKMTCRKQKKHPILSVFFYLDTIPNYFDFSNALNPLEFQAKLRFLKGEEYKKNLPFKFLSFIILID